MPHRRPSAGRPPFGAELRRRPVRLPGPSRVGSDPEMTEPVSRQVFLRRSTLLVGGLAAAGVLPGLGRASSELAIFGLDPEWGSGPACAADEAALARSCHACRSCHAHAAGKLFASAAAADAGRAHPGCKCTVTQIGTLAAERWIELFGDPGNLARMAVDRRTPWVAAVLAAPTVSPPQVTPPPPAPPPEASTAPVPADPTPAPAAPAEPAAPAAPALAPAPAPPATKPPPPRPQRPPAKRKQPPPPPRRAKPKRRVWKRGWRRVRPRRLLPRRGKRP